jgi:hypothetical protein
VIVLRAFLGCLVGLEADGMAVSVAGAGAATAGSGAGIGTGACSGLGVKSCGTLSVAEAGVSTDTGLRSSILTRKTPSAPFRAIIVPTASFAVKGHDRRTLRARERV